jgi:hypothetical protein
MPEWELKPEKYKGGQKSQKVRRNVIFQELTPRSVEGV